MSNLSWLLPALESVEKPPVPTCSTFPTGQLGTDLQPTFLINKGIAPLVPTVPSVPSEKQSSLESLTIPCIEMTHRTTCQLTFNNPETGVPFVIPAGTRCRQFASPTSAMLAGVPLDFSQNEGAMTNVRRGYSLVWLDGMLRGVSSDDVEVIVQ